MNEGKRGGESMRRSGGLLGRQKKRIKGWETKKGEGAVIVFSSWGEDLNRAAFMVHNWKRKLKGTKSKNDGKTELLQETAERRREKWLLNGEACCHLYQGMVA